jgi:drug/metabolite transporter (DMT)-like permease
VLIPAGRAGGLLMGLASALIGGGWQVATRHATTAGLQPVAPDDLVVLRYGVPALLLLPLVWRTGGLLPRGVPRGALLACVVGAGLPFGLLAISGTRHAPASHMGVLMAGASPLIAALLAWLAWRESPAPARRLGLLFMLAGVLLLAAPALADWSGTTWRGDALFLAAASLWAVYTLAFRRCGLTPWQAAALVNAWSFLFVLAWVAVRGGTGLGHVPGPSLAWQFLWQGLLAGVLGLWTFSVAIQRLGPAPAAAFGALAPVVSALGGAVWLGDVLSVRDAVAVAATVAGVLLASGVDTLRRPTAARQDG